MYFFSFRFSSTKECQMKHWQQHKAVCYELRKELTVQKFDSRVLDSKQKALLNLDGDNKQIGFYEKSACKENIPAEFKRCNRETSEVSTLTGKIADFCPGGQIAEDACKESSVTIIVKHNKCKHELSVQKKLPGKASLQVISNALCIPVSKLKLIHKGKMATSDNIHGMLCDKALFLAFGEVSESEEGLEKTDIDLIVKQLDVERNLAVKILRKTGNVLDAILEIGNL